MTAVAAFLTPPDIFSMLALAIPLIALYIISIFLVWMIERDRDKKAAAGAT
jgi:sec-independent protein translocase protein TatC